MASVASIGSKLTRIIDKSEKKQIDDKQKTQQLNGKWKGKAYEAFEGAYQEAPSLCKQIEKQAENAKGALSSLENVMETAERDMKEKREKSRRR